MLALRTRLRVAVAVAATILVAGCGEASDVAQPPPARQSEAPSAQAADEPAHWSYDGADGPLQWASLAADNAACGGGGGEQSPIDLPASPPAEASGGSESSEELSLEPGLVAGTVADTGHTYQFAVQQGSSTLVLDGTRYHLTQVHFHVPSEHLLAGTAAAAELHLVHADDAGDLLVIGVLVDAGQRSRAWAPFVASASGGLDDIALDTSTLLPDDLSHYAYEGSLTTPPCTEDVQWTVLAEQVQLSARQIGRLSALYPDSARPVQPLGHRSVTSAVATVSGPVSRLPEQPR